MTTRMYLLSMACLLAFVVAIWWEHRPAFDFGDPLGLGEISVGMD